ncbi:hypothetical protein Gotur_032401 [Gossypium turneri]
MRSVVGEKITCLIEYATNNFLPFILVCASGGARMQEETPTIGGVTASFDMLRDIIIAEPNAYIAFADKRVIEQTLNKTIPEGSEATEYLFHKSLFEYETSI